MSSREKRYWLLKSEPEVYSIDDMKKDGETTWDGIRNYQARNYMQKEMKPGDLALFYHSNAEPPGVAGVVEISREAQPDQTAFNPKSPYYDEKSKKDKPTWYCVSVKFKSKLKKFVSLNEIRGDKRFAKMVLLQKGSRLSVQPLSRTEFEAVLDLGED